MTQPNSAHSSTVRVRLTSHQVPQPLRMAIDLRLHIANVYGGNHGNGTEPVDFSVLVILVPVYPPMDEQKR